MKKLKYELSNEAVLDLEEIYQFTNNKWSTKQASLYYEILFVAVD